MLQTLLDFLIKFLGWLAPFTLKRAYPPTRLAELVKVRVSSESDGIEFWNGELPKARVWITILNLSRFPLELDRAFGTFAYGAELEKFTYLQRERLAPASEKTILLEASLTKEHALVIQRLISTSPKPEVRFNAHINCRINDFDINKTMATSHHRLVNFHVVG